VAPAGQPPRARPQHQRRAGEQLPSPAARFMCNPLISGNDGGHSIRLRELGRQGVRLHGHFEGTDDGVLSFSDDLPGRPGLVEAGFGPRMKVMVDAYIAVAAIDAPAAEAAPSGASLAHQARASSTVALFGRTRSTSRGRSRRGEQQDRVTWRPISGRHWAATDPAVA
jgi:hypothetical protein